MSAARRNEDAAFDAIRAASVTWPTGYSWFGEPTAILSDQAARTVGSDTARRLLVFHLAQRLYASFYCRGRATAAADTPRDLVTAWSPFIAALSMANTGTGSLEEGWTVVGFDASAIIVERDGLRLWVRPEELTGGRPSAVGEVISILAPKEFFRQSPGFYMALGNVGLPLPTTQPVYRLYWNLESAGGAPFMAAVTRQLNDAGIAFRAKAVNDPNQYTRCDAGVLYVLGADAERIRTVMPLLLAATQPFRKPETPVFTLPLDAGVGLAEEPLGGLESFGINRCRILAQGIVTAAEHGLVDPGAQLDEVRRQFELAGLDLARAHLNDPRDQGVEGLLAA